MKMKIHCKIRVGERSRDTEEHEELKCIDWKVNEKDKK
jgi:hypothetical protein